MRRTLVEVLKEYPDLTMEGLGSSLHGRSTSLIRKADRVEKIREWIQKNGTRRQTVYTKQTSYGMKHVAERDIGYISNGEFIAAMILEGYPFRRIGVGPNVFFAARFKRPSVRVGGAASGG